MSGSTPTGWPPIRFRSPPCATPSGVRTPTSPAATSPAALRKKSCAPWDASSRRASSTISAVATVNGAPIRIRDIGSAEDGTKEQRSLARLNGVPTVQLQVLRQSGANTVAVIEAVKQNLARVARQLPADMKLEVIRDQSRYIYAALHEINLHLILGSILACLVVLAFMRSWRSTIIAAVAIPASVISTFGMMWALGFTLNSVTMLALVLMVGVVIDDAIVVLENIFRFVEEKAMTPFEAARAATAEIGLAVMATTFSLVVIFVPVSFMSSISGRFLYQFGITAAVAVLVSLLVSFTLTPMMSARMLRPEDAGGEDAHLASGFLRLARPPLRAHARLVDGPSRHRHGGCRRGQPVVNPALQDGPPGIHSRPTSTKPSSTSTSPRPRGSAWRAWIKSCTPSRARFARCRWSV